MFIHYRSRAFILDKKDKGEADQLFIVFSKNFGKLEILAKGIRKISSKLRSGIEIFYLSDIEFIQGKTHKTLTDAILIDKFSSIRNNLKKLKIAYKIVETFNQLVKDEEADEKLWELLQESFNQLTQIEIKNLPTKKLWSRESYKNYKLEIFYYYFLWNLFFCLGYGPELYHCIVCQKRISPGKIFFSTKEGGLICQNCKKKLKLTNEISLETIKILRILMKKDWLILKKIKIKKENLSSLKKITQDYYRNIFREFIKNN